jgi:oxygen-dependent protoporphyrinogen oxidase
MTISPTRLPRRIAVIGGGIAGLAAAHRLQELGAAGRLEIELLLLEAGARLGGTVATERTDGFVIEAGPDSFISEKPWALDLCRRLALSERLVRTRDDHRRTFVVRDGRLHPLPEGFLLLAPTRLWPLALSGLFSWSGKLRMALDLVLPRGPARADESLGSLVTRRLGREALERVAQPLVGGIYTADPDRLSLAATMPRFLELERRHRSLILGMRRAERARRRAERGSVAGDESGARWSLFVSLAEGMQGLVDTLAARLPPDAARLGAPVSAVVRADGGRGFRVALADGVGLAVDGVVLATPAHVSARLLAALDAGAARELAAIAYASSATVTTAYRRADVPHPLDGFGFVVPFVENRRIIACTFSSVKFPGRAPEGHVLLRSFVGGALQAALADLLDAAGLEEAVRGELRDLLGITSAPTLVRVHRHPRAMPQYDVGHLDRIARLEQRLAAHPGLAVAGGAYHGVGIPDCVRGGELAAAAVVETLWRG